MSSPSLQYLLNKVKYHTGEARKYAAQYKARYHELVDDQDQPLAKIGNGEYAVEIEAQPQRRMK
jgi:hypothetical protein